MQTIWLWPNVDAGSDDISKGLRMYREQKKSDSLRFYRNFETRDYARLIANCSCLIGNSSSAIREGAFLGVPAVNIGTRQQAREHAGNVIFVDYNANEIARAIEAQLKMERYPSSALYGTGDSGIKIANILSDANIKIQKCLNY